MAEKYGRKVKELAVKEMQAVFSGNKGFVTASIENVKASDIDVLRKKLRHSGSRYMVVKNRLVRRALGGIKMEEIADTFTDSKILGIGLIKDDPVKVARLMVEFSRENKGFKVSSGYFDGDLLKPERIEQLSKLPGREQLIAMVAGTMNAPIANFVGVMSSIVQSLLHVLNSLKDKKQKTEK